MADITQQALLDLTAELLSVIDAGDWQGYCRLCADDLSAFEPEAVGNLVVGMPFHEFYFQQESSGGRHQSTVTSPSVRLLGDDAAVVTYVRLVQLEDDRGRLSTTAFEETRVWHKHDGNWKHVHFHRSRAGRFRS